LGVLLAVNPWLALIAAVVWLAVALLTRYSSLAAMVSAVATAVAAWFIEPGVYAGLTIVIALLLVRRHKQNILNLVSGTESRIGGKKKS
ncbi:glycerol-3-phosphate acyltransferase, partial [Laribacter hongkongensis]